MDYRFIVLQYCHLPSDFSSKIQSSITIFHHKLLTTKGRGYDQWMKLSIIHDSICILLLKKCRLKNYHNDIKYHTTLNIMFSIVSTYKWLNINYVGIEWVVLLSGPTYTMDHEVGPRKVAFFHGPT